MTIQLNADKNLTIHETYESQINAKLNKELDRFSTYLTRVEVHLSDENGSKNGQNDKRCLLEARLEGRPPIAVSDLGQTYDLALDGAIHKLKSAVSTIIDKLKDHTASA